MCVYSCYVSIDYCHVVISVYVLFASTYVFVPVYYVVHICIVYCLFSCMKTPTLAEPSIDKTYHLRKLHSLLI